MSFSADPLKRVMPIALFMTKDAGAKKGCLMASLPPEQAASIRRWAKEHIPDAQLADEGREDYVHVTACFGFPAGVTSQQVQKMAGFGDPVSLTLGKIKRFKADDKRPDSDVLVISVTSADLQALNASCKKGFDIQGNYAGYTPHCTLAYVKPGACEDLDGQTPFTAEATVREFCFSSYSGGERRITLIDIDAMTKSAWWH